jgi:indole-3-glycerol phosphate synthase
MALLSKIIEQKEKEIALLPTVNKIFSGGRVEGKRPFAAKILQSANVPAMIAEVKKASPSKGIIKEDFDPVAIAIEYEKAGAACLSVLTDHTFFKGSAEYIRDIRKHVSLPLLRKDFILDERQVIESAEMGADAILLIAACLSIEKLKKLYDFAVACGLECLVEVHSAEEVKRVYEVCHPTMIGINNRDLSTFNTNVDHTLTLLPELRSDTIVISESGIKTSHDVKLLKDKGVQAILVGETLMRAASIQDKMKELYHECSD